MISTSNIPVQNARHELRPRLAPSSKSQASVRALAASGSKTQETEIHDAAVERVGSSSQATPGQITPAANNTLTPALSPIEDKTQASVATQHVRALLQAQPRAAILAQANADSQRAQRLLP